MADLVSTLRITGRIGNRSISFTHTYTMTDVYDAGLRNSSGAASSSSYLGGSNVVGEQYLYLQDTPNYLLMANINPQFPVVFNVTSSSAPIIEIICAAGSFCILGAVSGMVNLTNATGSTTLLDVGNVFGNGLDGFPMGTPSIFMAFNGVS